MLRDFGWDRPGTPARVMSFSFTALQRVQRLAPDVPLVMLIDKAHHWPMLRRVMGADWIVGPGIGELRDHPGLGQRLVKSGRDIHVWTVNTASDLAAVPRARGARPSSPTDRRTSWSGSDG